MIRVLLVDDQHLVRMGLRMLFDSAPDIEVVGEAANGSDAVRLVDDTVPDVVLMDLRMPGLDGVAATRRIMSARPSTRILALTTFDDDDHLYPVLSAGACGFLVKDTAPADLLDAVRRAAEGDHAFSPNALARLVDQALTTRSTTSPPPLPLTRREHQILALIGEGLSNPEIADRLNVGVTTVKTHVSSVMIKTGCPNRIRLAILASQHNLT
ncbi:DNA-binding response regulator [Acrocarpospora pleiomorpha]|uniref:DNA-binding response regulator n=1 Tax=Acrocarpospora pleiomorpha TaxID=90975 RepID=A0A5M3XPF6_9ACTN|nr:response regulator transcription factor [Acrocarpospora pleiomorpha]GES22616.1 DNA-binding response regulator [Acrocarpospora pleiomorpha]